MLKEDLKCTENEEVKSTAIVKYSVPKPAQFTKLQCNTDLNLPPSNWLSSTGESYGLQHVLHHPKGFSSFRMAHMFPDCVGDVDVVSDAENIKKLLKIPYSKGHISMIVHRIENTLLLDDFDIYKYLLRTAETEWEWLRKFFYEHIDSDFTEENRNLYIKNRRRKALQQQSLVSKFLYHSLVESNSGDQIDLDVGTSRNIPIPGPILPEPSPANEVPDSEAFNHKYNRNVVWTFEEIEMLLGTDMPIFGGGTHPCISLRLSDMSKPINVLTGIDYWLDNLMSNVPEVIMCYHLNGIVQKYEFIKTEDLPRLDNSKFSPKLIRDVAQSILSFLKSNATKAGHTYWLFKGKDEEVVKLYDLTSLCSETETEKDQNPFIVPVAMLLYRVARNMKHSNERYQPGTIRMLLKNCLKLLNEEKYPEIVTSSHYMLSDLYIPANTNPESPGLDQTETDDNESVYDDDDDDLADEEGKEPATKTLILNSNIRCDKFVNCYKPPPPIAGSVEERCLQAIQHIASGLNCLQYFDQDESEKQQRKKEEENIQMAKPFEPIPMPYSKIDDTNEKSSQENKKGKKSRSKKKFDKIHEKVLEETFPGALLPKSKGEAQPLPTWQERIGSDNISWKQHLKTLLYEKAVLVYATLAEANFLTAYYGSSLRNIGLLVRCQQIMNKLSYSNPLRENCLLGRAGDCCIMMVQNWENEEKYRDQFHTHLDEDLKMMEQLEKDEQMYGIQIAQSNMKCVLIYDIRTIEQMLLKGVECYEEALTSCESDSILRRLGNSLNEVGSLYLNRAKLSKTEDCIIDTCKKAEPYLKRGLEVFEKVKDDANIALLYTNMGHLHRLLAHASTPSERGELTTAEKLHYNKAFVNYKRALQVLGDRKHCPSIWDAVKWELSTALFTMGTIMHENPSPELTKAEAEKEVIEILQKALQYCDLDEENPKYPLYQYRAAVIYYRLGSLYHNRIWNTTSDPLNRKNIIQLSKLNYEKAAKLYYLSMDATNYLISQMQHFALCEFLAETATTAHTKIKHYQNCLSIIIESKEMIQMLVDKKIELPEEDTGSIQDSRANENNASYKNCHALICLAKQRLQYVLRTLTKLCLNKPPANKDCPKLASVYKSCYALTFDLTDNLDFYSLISKLCNVISEISIRISDFNISC